MEPGTTLWCHVLLVMALNQRVVMNRFCGTILNEYTVLQDPDNTAAGSLTTYEAPFMLSYVTNDKEDSAGSPPERGNAGFCLKWVQEP